MPLVPLQPKFRHALSFAIGLLVSGVSLAQQSDSPKTAFSSETGEYAMMLSQLEHSMLNYQEKSVKTLGGKQRNVFVPWIRDHVHVMKAMKYIHPDMESFIEFYLQNQTTEGIYFDYYFPINAGGINDRMKLFDKRYWKIIPEDSIQMHRLPVEADLEYLLVEGVYAVWQSTGDTAFVKQWLPNLVKGITYSMTDPLRWSKKYQLVKRGYTLDTWDFMQLPTSRDEYTRNGGNIQKGIFNIDENTPMGIMHGDNSGIYAACNQLSMLFRVCGNPNESKKWNQKALSIRKRTNELCWNGKYYAHFIEDDPQPAYLKMDQKNTLSLSNPYDINRGLPTRQMAASIIETYQKLKETNKKHSFAEWYGVYPAVEPHFADYKPGSYMNGGVNTIVAGELAKAALQNGYEEYGVDILERVMTLMQKYNGNLPVSYTPEGRVDEGIPDNWGQAAVYSALIEGLAGVVDQGTQFKKVEISPRWLAARKNKANVSVVYGPTQAKVSYEFEHFPTDKRIQLRIDGEMSEAVVRLLLPADVKSAKAYSDGELVKSTIEVVNKSKYITMKSSKPAGLKLEIIYK
jgi:hypothetical protein